MEKGAGRKGRYFYCPQEVGFSMPVDNIRAKEM